MVTMRYCCLICSFKFIGGGFLPLSASRCYHEGGMIMEELIDDFVKKLREKSSSTVTAVQIFVSGSDSEILIQKRTPEELRRDGVSMVNLKGEWIK
jgi:hypothetical protein